MCLNWGTKERGICPGLGGNFAMRTVPPPLGIQNGLRGLTCRGQSQENSHQAPGAHFCSSFGGNALFT